MDDDKTDLGVSKAEFFAYHDKYTAGSPEAEQAWEAKKEMDARIARKDQKTVLIMGDIQPYVSMIDGTVINSRSKHREHLRQHGCIEVGNELKHTVKKKEAPKGLKEDLIRVTNQKLGRY